MLLFLAEWFSKSLHGLFVIEYLTMRAILSVITALCLVWFLGPWVIRRLRFYKLGETVREGIGLDNHASKKGTPTMGGVLILASIALTTLLWGDLRNSYLWIVLLVTLGFGLIGAYDDFCKLTRKMYPNRRGIPSKVKFLMQSAIALTASILLYFHAQTPHETQLVIPFFKNVMINIGLGYILLSYLVIVGSSNAVNLTDGLDGLAIMPAVLVAAGLGIFAYLTGNFKFADYLLIPYVNGVGEIIVFVGAIVGAGLGFLWFNSYPAEVFMGDVGSLALGAALGTMAVMVRQEIVLFIMGGIFVLETVSVILQVGSFKMTGKRIFRMAPIHHHFELKGWPEPKVIVRFWIITFLLVMLGLATLKLR